MRALTYQGPYRVRVENKPDPIIEHPQDVILKVTKAAICGSDLHLLHGLIADTRVGCTFGHEFMGVVEETGREVKNLRKGDRVVVPFNISCGTCFYCQRGLTALCENSNPAQRSGRGRVRLLAHHGRLRGRPGRVRARALRGRGADEDPGRHGGRVGALPERHPAHRLPGRGDGRRSRPGETVVVFGAGPVGLFAMKSAWLMGAGRVIAVDHLPYRLAFAEQYAKVETVNFKEVGDVVLHLREMCGGRGAGRRASTRWAWRPTARMMHKMLGLGRSWRPARPRRSTGASSTVRKGGNVSIIGVYGPPWNLITSARR